MVDSQYLSRVRELYQVVEDRLRDIHVRCFDGMEKPLLFISDTYPGVWLEHVYDAVFYATLEPAALPVAEHTVNLFMNRQTPEGQLPCYIWDGGSIDLPSEQLTGYGQIQECVSFTALCLRLYKHNRNHRLLQRAYACGSRWVGWLRRYRMTTGRGLVEVFCGYDTGHDQSGRLAGLTCPGNYFRNGVLQNAAVLPPNDPVAPILAVDMNANFYGTLRALSCMADRLGLPEEAADWRQQATDVKQRLFAYCYDEKDGFFYDVDKEGNRRRYLFSTVFHLFMEGVLDPREDSRVIRRLYEEHIKNPKEFWTAYPFPSMAANDPSAAHHAAGNCWGYFTQGLIALRSTLWMDAYGYGADLDLLCERWVEAWTTHADRVPFGQELDPHTGVPSPCSGWYSSSMLFYLYAVRRLGYLKD